MSINLNNTNTEIQDDLGTLVFENLQEGVIITDRLTRILRVNPAFTRITGYTAGEIIGKTPKILCSGRHDPGFYKSMWEKINTEKHWSGEIWNRRQDGGIYPEWLSINSVSDVNGVVTHYVGIFSDLTRRKHLEEQLYFHEWHDPLTRLPSRQFLEVQLAQAIVKAEHGNYQLAVIFLDLDEFKVVNNSLGHTVGDQMLEKIAERLSQALGPENLLARQGGDEFIILMPRLHDSEEVIVLTEKVLDQFDLPFEVEGEVMRIGASLGIALYPGNGKLPEDLLRHADTAMYSAKNALSSHGHRKAGNYMFYGARESRSLNRYLRLREEMERALVEQEFVLHYQPQIDMCTGHIVAAEALIRWQHPERGLLPPSEFIFMAEQTSLILPIGDWVIEQVCRQLSSWKAAGLQITLAANLSVRQFKSDSLLAHVERCMSNHPFDSRYLEFEITESILMDKTSRTHHFIDSCREKGIRFSIDDFGTGYSSLAYLEALPVNAIKIDQRFVAGMLRNRKDLAIVKAIIEMGHAMNLKLVAEGIETPEQSLTLKEMGCDLAQGFWFHRPMPVNKLEQILGIDGSFNEIHNKA
ncbi:MAG: EAL domain-containing protein [Pseudomonadota bacterium]|nr:EAL domain-containing protein [Pseudomonadota bacterium]